MKRKPYSSHKLSNAEWLGNIPTTWTMVPIKRQYNIQLGKMLQNLPESDSDILVPYIKALHVLWDKVETSELPEMWANPKEIKQFGVKSGDLLVCEGGEAGRAGIIDFAPDPCIIQNAVHRVRSEFAEVGFLKYVLHAIESSGWFDVLCNKATIFHFTREKLAELKMPLPTCQEEQRYITYFLDRETEQIDALIEKKEKQIELLREKRQAIITQAVTKGLDSDVPMKDTSIEWLGEIPNHWSIVKLKYCVVENVGSIKTGPFGSQLLSSEMNNGDIKVYNQRTVLDKDFQTGENYITKEKYEELKAFTVYPGDVLLTTRGSIGRCVIVPDDAEVGILHPCLMRIQTSSSTLNREFLSLLIQDSVLVQTQLALASNATTIDVIYSDTIKNIFIPLPSINEQSEIIDLVNKKSKYIDNLISKMQVGIRFLKEYRSTLITAAVTGKIDVRESVEDKK